MDGLNIVIIILLILVIFWVINNWLLKSDILMDIMSDCSKVPDNSAFDIASGTAGIASHLKDATQTNPYIIPASRFGESLNSNFSITVWFYVYLWDTTTTKKNILFLAKNQDTNYADGITEPSTPLKLADGELSKHDCTSSDDYRSLAIFLDTTQNDLYIDILTGENMNICNAGDKNVYSRYLIKNIDIQKWNCLSISIDTTTLDVYMDGKLLNSFVMNGIYYIKEGYENRQNMYIGSADAVNTNINKGANWNGIVTRVRYNNHSINPEEAYSIYKEGINTSLANSILNKYGLKVQFLEYNKPKGEFTI